MRHKGNPVAHWAIHSTPARCVRSTGLWKAPAYTFPHHTITAHLAILKRNDLPTPGTTHTASRTGKWLMTERKESIDQMPSLFSCISMPGRVRNPAL